MITLLMTQAIRAQYSAEVQQQLDDYNKIIKSPLSSKLEKADAWNGLGWVYRLNFEYDRAIEAHQEAADIFIKEKHIWGQALSYSYIGYVYMARKSYSLALDYLDSSYKLFNDGGFKEDAAFVTTQIAYIYCYKYDYTKALTLFEKAYKISEKAGDEKGMTNALNGCGYIYGGMGNQPKAMEYFEKSLAIHRLAKNDAGIASSLLDIGWMYFEQGNFYKVLDCGEESLDLYNDLYDQYGIASAYNMLGLGYKELAIYDKALYYFQRSLSKSKEIENLSSIGTAYNNIATVYFMQRNLPEALKYHELGLATHKELGDKNAIALSNSNVGTVYFNLDQVEKGKEYILKAEKMAYETGNPRLIRISKRLLFEISAHQGDLVSAEKYGLEMMEMNDKSIALNFPTLSESEKEKFFQNLNPEYMEFNQFVLQRKTENPSLTSVVYNNTLKHKGLLLKSSTAMRHAILGSKDTALVSQYDNWLKLKKEIADAYTNGTDAVELEEKANALEKELVKGSQAFSDLDKIQKLTWQDVQDNLKEDEAAVEFIHFNEFDTYGTKLESIKYCALVVTPACTSPIMVELCKEQDLVDLLGTYGGNNLNYINTIYGTASNPNTRLYELAWKPFESYLGNAKTVYLAPTGLLHRVSFAAMAKEKSVLLCDQYNLELQSSTGKVAMPETFSLDANRQITLFGGIDYDTESSTKKIWSYLEGTKVEVENISQLFGTGGFSVAQSKTEEGFKENAPASDIIHMSTHGFFYPDPSKVTTSLQTDSAETGDLVFRGSTASFGIKNFVFNKNPLMRSGLVLSGANDVWNNSDMTGKEDGVLTAYEVAQVDLRRTSLVVLSACETGLGDINGSEGVYGLQRAFKMAGVKYIVMSLWQVPDKETQEFMTLFYKNLLLTKDPKPAFVKTQLALRKMYDPYFWAAFVLIE
jgi:CHAT domain-containing protein/tetratricopeptide (TPR) repeat protein